MRVVLVSHNARVGDATGQLLAAKARAFGRDGAAVRVVVESVQHLRPDLRAVTLQAPSARPAGAVWEAARAADLVCFEFGHAYPLLNWLPWLADQGVATLADYHGITPPEWQEASRRADAEFALGRRGLLRRADAVVVQSRFMAAELERVGVDPDRITTVPPPVDPVFRPGPSTHALRRRFGIGDAPLALFVGRVAPNKRLPVLVDALALLPNFHAVVVGDTGDVYGLERRRCEVRARALGVAGRLHFAGHVGEGELVDAYRSADVFVMPSRHEGYCMPVAEALACGLPVVAANAAALPETLADRGALFEPDDVGGLARAVIDVRNQRGASASCMPPPVRPELHDAMVCEVALRALLRPGRCRASQEGNPHEMSRHRGGRFHRLAPERRVAAARS